MKYFIICLLLLGTACSRPTPDKIVFHNMMAKFPNSPFKESVYVAGIPYIKDIDSYETPLIYNKWWGEVEGCTGLYIPDTEKNKIKFYYIRAEAFYFNIDTTKTLFDGYTFPMYNKIYVIKGDMLSEKVIKHEMVHILMYHNGDDRDHPPVYFNNACHTKTF